MKLNSHILTVVLMASVSCATPGDGKNPTGRTDNHGAASALDSAKSEWYKGKSEVFSPDGRLLATSDAMCRRQLYPDLDIIVEQLVSLGRKGKAQEFITIFRVKEKSIQLVELNGSFAGIGELSGQPWRWDHWHSVSTMMGGEGASLPKGSTVESDDRKNANGFVAQKRILDPNGHLMFRITETYRSVPEQEYVQTYKKLFSSSGE
jgi:hypothetical protein